MKSVEVLAGWTKKVVSLQTALCSTSP